MDDITLSTLCENTAGKTGLLGEHGLAILLECGERHILFDTGPGLTTLHNAGKMRVSLDNIDAVVLSHGHRDHTGGMKAFLEHARHATVWAHPEAMGKKYKVDSEGRVESIGMPWERKHLEDLGARFRLGGQTNEIASGILVTGEIPRATDYEVVSPDFRCGQRHEFQDRLIDDQSMVVVTPQGLLVLLGCAHAGVIKTLTYAMNITGENHIVGLFGGMHLVNAHPERIKRTVDALMRLEIGRIGGSHCTGFLASAALHKAFGGIFRPNIAGDVTTIPC